MGLRALFAILLALFVLGCNARHEAAQPPKDSPRRIVCLAPSITELLFALDAGDLVVGTAEYSDYPPQASDLPEVGSYARPNLERILELAPDLCLAVQDGTPDQALHRLGQLGIPTQVLGTGSLEELFASMLAIGKSIQRRQQAEELVNDLKQRLEHIRILTATVQKRPLVLFQVSGPHIMAAGSGSLIGQLIQLAGGDNVAPASAGYPQLSAEQVLAAAPDIVVAFHMLGHDQDMAGWPADPRIPAVRNHRLYSVDPALFARPGPRVIEALEALARIIHPEIFGEFTP